MLKSLGYAFTTVTPTTHRIVNARAANRLASNLGDVFGWNRPFVSDQLPRDAFELMRAAGACERLPSSTLWRATVRFSSVDGLLFAHSAFPTSQRDAVFLGPDTYRFIRAVKETAVAAKRVVDIGCGSGAGGIVLAHSGLCESLVLADVSTEALRFAELNAALAEVEAEVVESDVLTGVTGDADLIIANPPYLLDAAGRVYRDGGGTWGEALALRMVRSSIERLRNGSTGGTLLLYTGAAIVEGRDTFLDALLAEPAMNGVTSYSYEEIDPDVFSDELEEPAYAAVDRIAAVFLQISV